MRIRRHRFRHQYGRHEDKLPEQRSVLDLPELRFHGGCRLHTGSGGGKSGLVATDNDVAQYGPQAGKRMPSRYVVRVNACARRSTRRSGSGRGLLGRRWRHGRGSSRSDAWFTATVYHAHFPSAAFTDRGPHRWVPYTDAFDQLTPQPTSLASWNDRIVRLLKGGVRHALCRGNNAKRERNDGGSDHCFLSSVTEAKPMTSPLASKAARTPAHRAEPRRPIRSLAPGSFAQLT
jgi:hypothetical protein